MKLKNSYFFTLRENAKDEDSISSNLLVRAGMIKKNSAGVYMILPLGLKVLRNIETIIRDEMEAINCQELIMPALIPEEVYIKSGRRENFGSSMFSLKDRFNKPYVLGPTHEELFAIAAQMKIKSYKDLPFSIYQFQTKFRDEPRPRYGLIRVREFIMKDSYSFDSTEDGMNIQYQNMFNAYVNAFNKMKLNYRIVKADTGAMGGLLSEEFQALSEIGEDTLVTCDTCDLSSNIEIAPCVDMVDEVDDELLTLEKIHTPNTKTIDDLVKFFDTDATKFMKTLIYKVDEKDYIACMVAGNREVNEVKVSKLLNTANLRLAEAHEVFELCQCSIGFIGPINLNCPVICDTEVSKYKNFIVGANVDDYHFKNVNLKDFTIKEIADIRNIQENDICPICGGRIKFSKGIEVGNTFKLGTKYAEALNVKFLDQDNKLKPVWMGSYGIGPARCMAAIAEQFADEAGLNWPISVAPYKVAIVVISDKDEQQLEIANNLYDQLSKLNISCLLDDRKERPGVKFKDMELIGIPIRITVGKTIADQQVEVKLRDLNQEKQLINLDEVINYVTSIIIND